MMSSLAAHQRRVTGSLEKKAEIQQSWNHLALDTNAGAPRKGSEREEIHPSIVEMGSWIFLLLSFLPLSFADSPEPQYALIVPSVLHSDASNQACVHLQNLNESVSLKISLDYNMDHYALWEGPVAESHFYQCINFTAPPATSEPLAFVDFSVEGTTLHFHNRRGVALQNRTSAVFIQTDKPIYKPGQKVMFRIFTLNDEFKLVNKVYPLIHITDPESNRIAQWKNQTSSTSFLQLEFQLDEFPNLGNYRIAVADETSYGSDHWFEVKEYVLPTFSMKTTVPQRVSPFDEEFEVNVCAKYTYGQPVQGVVQLRVCRQRYYHPRCAWDSEGICEAVSAQNCDIPVTVMNCTFLVEQGRYRFEALKCGRIETTPHPFNQSRATFVACAEQESRGGHLDKDGCVSNTIQTKAFQLHAGLGRDRYFYVSLQVSTVLTENGTGIQKTTRDYVSVYLAKKSVSLEHLDQYYRRQIPYTGKIRLRDEDHAPIANGLLFLEFDGKVLGNFTTDKDGAAQFSIDTSDLYQPSYKLRVYHEPDQCSEYGWLETDQPEATQQINRFYSRTDSFVKVEPVLEELKCDEHRPVTVHYVLNTDHHGGKTAGLDFFYVLLNQGKIVDGGKQQVSVNVGHHGTFSISLDADEKLSPRAKLLVYILHDNELVADSISFEVEKCFRNKVSLEFSEKKALPASTVELNIEAASNSICALRAVDKSILLLKPGGDLTPGSVQSRLSHMPIYGYYFGVLDLDDELVEPCIELKDTFSKGLYYLPVNVTHDGNVFDIVKELGLKVFTSSSLRKPVVCKSDLECKKISSDYSDNEVYSHKRQDALAYGGSAGGIVETVRQYFPETWIWNTVSVDSSGKATLPYTVPDTITEWEANMLCVDDETGFGISRPAQLTAFQPFFIELTLPYSIIRKESFLLNGNVFNYMNVCLEVSTTLEESQDYKAENLSPENDVTEVCSNERKTHTWRIHPQTLGHMNLTVTAEAKPGEVSVGRRDTVIRSLLVEPEGVKKEVTQSSLICVKGTSATEPVSLQLPENLVEDSAKAYVSVLGDVMGTAMSDAENFLRMPTGCGEQNIAMFLANLAVLNYLNDTKQLTEEKRSMFVGRLSTGYQRQLSYRVHDGSFTTYGNQFEEGNLWVTVLTYKALALSKEWIYVDDDVLNRALLLIASKQKPDGCFRQTGDIFNNAVKEGENYSLLLTARVAAALLEAGRPSSYPVVQKCLSCLDTASAGGADVTYEKALLAYTYSLAEDEERRQVLLEGLKNVATKTGNLLYWEREIRPAPETFRSFYPRAPSADIEMTSYALLAFLSQPTITQELLTFASQVAQWLVRQQNPYGGFASSQDTHVALQALSRYGVLTYTKDAQNTVVIKSAEGTFQTPFQVNSENRVLLQRVALPSVPGDYNVEVEGSGCAYIQTTLRYNVILPSQASGFSLTVRTRNPACTGNFLPRFELVLTISYTGKRNVSNMAIVDIKMLSGFVPVESSLQQLSNQVMRRETRNDHMLLYMRNVSLNTTTLTFMVEESYPVTNIQPAQVKTYDYYETDESALAEYNTPCPHSSS